MDFKTVHENRGYVPGLRKGMAKCPTCVETLKYTHESLRNLSKYGFFNVHVKFICKYHEILSVSGLSRTVFLESGQHP